MAECIICGLPVEPYSCSRKRCTKCIAAPKNRRVKKAKPVGYCPYCGMFGILTRDHIVPKSRGGARTYDNIAMICGWCNESKADLLLQEWLDLLPPDAPQHYYVNALFAPYHRGTKVLEYTL